MPQRCSTPEALTGWSARPLARFTPAASTRAAVSPLATRLPVLVRRSDSGSVAASGVKRKRARRSRSSLFCRYTEAHARRGCLCKTRVFTPSRQPCNRRVQSPIARSARRETAWSSCSSTEVQPATCLGTSSSGCLLWRIVISVRFPWCGASSTVTMLSRSPVSEQRQVKQSRCGRSSATNSPVTSICSSGNDMRNRRLPPMRASSSTSTARPGAGQMNSRNDAGSSHAS